MPPNIIVNKSKGTIKRVSMLLWGLPGCGKTHFANTAPGKRLWINFDPDGTSALAYSEDTLVLDYSAETLGYMEQCKTMNPFDLDSILKNDPSIQTVVIDSVSRFVSNAVQFSIGRAPGATFENPGPAGYGFRNRFTIGLVNGVLIATGKHNKHVIFIGHEGQPQTNESGVIQAISILLGGDLQVTVPQQISEVWRMTDNGLERRVTVRQIGLAKPMKTRMFDTTSGYDFIASNKVNASKVDLAVLFKEWQDGNYEKLKLPT